MPVRGPTHEIGEVAMEWIRWDWVQRGSGGKVESEDGAVFEAGVMWDSGWWIEFAFGAVRSDYESG